MRFRFRLRSLFLVVTVASVPLGFWTSARRQAASVALLKESCPSVVVLYEHELESPARWRSTIIDWLSRDWASSPALARFQYPIDADLVLVSRLTTLRGLRLARAIDVTDDGLDSLARLSLHVLSIEGADGLTDRALATLSQLTTLESLRLDVTWHMTDRGLAKLAALGKLETLELHLPPGHGTLAQSVTSEGIAALERLLPRCRIRVIRDVPGDLS